MKLMTYAAIGCATVLTATSVFAMHSMKAGSNNGILFTANLSTKEVTHKLFSTSNHNAPHPFYKNICSKSKPKPYKDASGFGTFWFNPKTRVLKYAFSYQGISGIPIMMHFHVGKEDVGGPIIQTICGNPPPGSKALGYSNRQLNGRVCPNKTSGFISGSYVLRGNRWLKISAKQEAQDLMDGKLYVNIHTCLNEAGEVRGQIERAND